MLKAKQQPGCKLGESSKKKKACFSKVLTLQLHTRQKKVIKGDTTFFTPLYFLLPFIHPISVYCSLSYQVGGLESFAAVTMEATVEAIHP